jgi:protein TonB
VSPGELAKSRWSAWPVSLAAHGVTLGALLVVPILSAPALPVVPSTLTVFMTAPDRPQPPPPRRVVDVSKVPDSLKAATVAPTDAPYGVVPETGLEMAAPELTSGAPDPGVVPGVEPGLLAALERVDPPAPPDAPVRPGVQIDEPRKIVDAPLSYPPAALAARVEGVVIIEATIGLAGDVEDARVLRSAPLLDQAALDAVRRWKYTPTRLNGVPVRVILTVTVRFKLRDQM